MKESWMKKLIKLLNEFWKPSCRGKKREKLDLECADRFYAISKYYGFIKWLVENEKIERLAFAESWLLGKYTDFELSYDTPREDYTNMLLMELSIQDNPIEYLISVLR